MQFISVPANSTIVLVHVTASCGPPQTDQSPRENDIADSGNAVRHSARPDVVVGC